MQAVTRPPQPQLTVRRYEAADQPAVAAMCAGVYGGHDYMPRMVASYAADPSCTLLVAADEAGGGVCGVVAGQARGSAFFLFGLRVAEESRGRGVAKALMAAIVQAGCEQPGVAALTSATIPANAPALALFAGLGFAHSHSVDAWPAAGVRHAYEQAVGFVPCQLQQPAPAVRLLEYTGAAQLVQQECAALGVGPADWEQCSCAQQLEAALASIRQQQAAAEPQLAQPRDSNLGSLPFVYESFALDSPWTQQRLAAGELWLLRQPAGRRAPRRPSSGGSSGASGGSEAQAGALGDGSSSSSPGSSAPGLSSASPVGVAQGAASCRALLVLTRSQEHSLRWAAGIVTASDAWLAPAVGFVASKQPHFLVFADRGSRHASTSRKGAGLPRLFDDAAGGWGGAWMSFVRGVA